METTCKPEFFSEFIRPNQVNKKSLEARIVFLALNQELETGTRSILNTDEVVSIVKGFTSVQLLEFSGILTSSQTVKVVYDKPILDLSLLELNVNANGSRCAKQYNLSWLFIQEMVVRCSNNMRAAYDELHLGLDEKLLNAIITSPVNILTSLAEHLEASRFITLKVMTENLIAFTEESLLMFAQDELHTKAVKYGATTQFLEFFFCGHKCNDNRSLTGMRTLLSYKDNAKKISASNKSAIYSKLMKELPDVSLRHLRELSPELKMKLFRFHLEQANVYGVSIRSVWDVTRSKTQFKKFYPTEID